MAENDEGWMSSFDREKRHFIFHVVIRMQNILLLYDLSNGTQRVKSVCLKDSLKRVRVGRKTEKNPKKCPFAVDSYRPALVSGKIHYTGNGRPVASFAFAPQRVQRITLNTRNNIIRVATESGPRQEGIEYERRR